VLAALTKQVTNQAAAIDAVAGALNLSPTDLAKQLAGGTSLFAIAKTQNVDIKTVLAAIQKARGVTPSTATPPGMGKGKGGPRGGFGFGRHGRFMPPGGGKGFFGHGRGGFGKKGGKGAPPPPPTTTQSTNGG
jgi:hypothetical protein